MLLPVLFALQSLASGGTCPAPEDVQARVRNILHLSPEQQLTESFLVERHEAGLYVVLKAADASVIGERTLPLASSCDELAQAAAVVLSAWLTDVHPDFAGALPAPASDPASEPPTALEPEPAKPDVSEPGAKPSSVTPPRPQAPPDPARANPGRFEWGAGVGGDLSPVGLAPAILASAGYGPESTGWGVALLVASAMSREQVLGPGVVEWRRWPLSLGPSWRLTSLGLRWDVIAGPAVAWLHLVGKNFMTQETQDGATFGGALTIRAAGKGRLAPFGLVNLQYYPGDSVAFVTDNTGATREWVLPHVTLLLTAGLRFAH